MRGKTTEKLETEENVKEVNPPKISKKKKKSAENVDESEETEETEIDDVQSSFLTDCKIAFGSTSLYEILALDKDKATKSDIKKAYYKLSLKYHPDKATDALLTEDCKFKFQCLGKIYSILSDENKKKLYDESGVIDGEDDFLSKGDHKDWQFYFRNIFKKVTKADFDNFFKGYKDSKEERDDLIRIFEKFEGDMEMVMEEMIADDVVENEIRFREILHDAIEKKETLEFVSFKNENKRKAAKRKAHYKKEAKEAEEARKELGIDGSQDSLRQMILSRRQDQSSNFLDNLAKKYEKENKNEKVHVFRGNTKKTEVKSDSEIENEPDTDGSTLSEEDTDEDAPPSKKRSSLVKKKPITKSKAKTASTKTALKRKVKRL